MSGYDKDDNPSDYNRQLECEMESAKEPPAKLPEGTHYVADTRRQSLNPAAGDTFAAANSVENTRCNMRTRGYLPIENYGIIGNLRTIALCGTDGSCDFYCYPNFDSPSMFARLLDKNKGGHFCIAPHEHTSNKQQYMPKSNILVTRFLSDAGVAEVIDYMHVPAKNQRQSSKPLLPWLIRTVRVIRGTVSFKLECYPAFNYGQDEHIVHKAPRTENKPRDPLEATFRYPEDQATYETSPENYEFRSKSLNMDLRYLVKCGEFSCPKIDLQIDEHAKQLGHKGPGVFSEFEMSESQEAVFIWREVPEKVDENDPAAVAMRLARDPPLTVSLLEALFRQTVSYWQSWIDQCSYRGRWRETVHRSALTLKLLTYEPTGAVVAAPTFGIPEAIGGPRNWDYRYLWVRDSAFTIYAFLRLGFTEEAGKFMKFIEERCKDLNPDGSLNIMYSIHGEKYLEEIELPDLEGYRESRPVRIGNGAYDHLQLDIYGELMDGIYLYNKYGAPIGYDMWLSVRNLVNYVCDNWATPDMSIWEVRGKKQRFTYSMVMCWVAVDRGLRLSEKRQFPLPERDRWFRVRDEIYTTVQEKCWNPDLRMFSQSMEDLTALDASCLIMPLVFFSSPVDPRLLDTVERILLPPEKGGLVANNLVFRYNFLTTDDGVGGIEGAFSMCTFWLVEALARAGKYDRKMLNRAVVMFEEMLSYANHLGIFSEEIARSGEQLGNTPQAFTHMSFISAAFNLDRVLGNRSS